MLKWMKNGGNMKYVGLCKFKSLDDIIIKIIELSKENGMIGINM